MKPKEPVNPENIPGPFSITEECISCEVCWKIAPDFIESHPIHTYAYFYKQPKSDLEVKKCMEALKTCPVECIYFEDVDLG